MSAYRSNELQIIQPCHDVPLHSLAVGVQPSAVDLSRFSLPVFPIAVDGDQQCAAGPLEPCCIADNKPRQGTDDAPKPCRMKLMILPNVSSSTV